MKSIACETIVIVLALAGCGGEKKPAEEPQNAESNTDAAAAVETPAEPDHVPTQSTVVGGDDTAKPTPTCSGFDIPDLLAEISNAACEVPDAKPGTQQKDLKDLLDVKVTLDSPIVAPGSNAQVTITYKNKSKADLPLYFVVDPEPRFDFEAYTLKGVRADNPSTPAPPLPPEVANNTAPEPKYARVTLAQLGTGKIVLKWNAVKYKWASKDRAKGALPGRGYPRDPGGPLKKGKYILRVITPLTGIFEGGDHEVSQPRTQVTVGGI